MLRYTGGRNTSGYLVIKGENGLADEAETLSCSHCQYIWAVKPGSGLKRGWCFSCNKPVCGKKACLAKCAPWEKQVEEMEAKQRFWNRMKGLK